ncbi:site-specific integrase [Cupriavidus oxalaticus]|uniref:site-specific integrase n=1 Tax=Cupriavidus oxalaticus TaxID=96344 RepID=UPI003F7347A2
MKLERMDVLKLEAGSPLLGGEGFLSLEAAAQAMGLTVPELATEAANQGENLHAYADGWPCVVVDDRARLTPDGEDGSYCYDEVADAGRRETLRSHVMLPDAQRAAAMIAATGALTEGMFFLDSKRRRTAFASDLDLSIPAAQISIEKAAAERIRHALKARLSPEAIESAKMAASRPTALLPGHKYAGMRASELVDAFMKFKVDGGHWTNEDHRRKMETELGVFVELMGNPTLGNLDRPAIDRYRNMLGTLPANLYQARRKVAGGMGLPLAELARQAAAKGLPSMGAQTIDAYVRRLSEMLGWAVKCDYLTKNPAQSVTPKRKATRAQDARDAFSVADLELIFSADWFKTGRGEATRNGTYRTFCPHYYWLPLLGLYTGARINELSQLYLDDVRQTSNRVWYLDFNRNGADKLDVDAAADKSLKSPNAEREVPLHGVVLAQGFVEYVQALRAAGHKRLFPELRYSEHRGYGKAATSWFNERYLGERLGMERNGRKVFHSFRHTFLTAVYALQLSEHTVNQLSGHARGKTTSSTTYRKDQPADEMRPYIDKLTFKLPTIAPFDVAAGLDALKDALARKKGC